MRGGSRSLRGRRRRRRRREVPGGSSGSCGGVESGVLHSFKMLLRSFGAEGVSEHACAAGQRAAGDGAEVILVHVDVQPDELRPAGGVRQLAQKIDRGDGRGDGHLEVVGDDEPETRLEQTVHERL